MTQHNLTIAKRRPPVSFRKVGGLYHWRIGSFGGSFYRSRRRSRRLAVAFAGMAMVACIPQAQPSYSAIVTLSSGNEYVIEHGASLSDCRAVVADMSPNEARCETE